MTRALRALGSRGMGGRLQRTPERRATRRHDKVFAVLIHGPAGSCYGVARNISDSGIYVEARCAEPLGAELEITFLAPDAADEMTLAAVLRSVRPLPSEGGAGGMGRRRGLGLAFVGQLAQGGCERLPSKGRQAH